MKTLLIIAVIFLLTLVSLACVLPSAALRAEPPVKAALATATPAPQTMVVCVTVDTVRLREGVGTDTSELAVLTAGDMVEITGWFSVSEDGGVWWPVEYGDTRGWINARYLCE